MNTATTAMAAGQYRLIKVTPLSPNLGADVEAGDLREISDEQGAEIRKAWLAHSVIRLRNQNLDDNALIALGRRFGDLQISNPLPSPRARAADPASGTLPSVVQAPRDERVAEVTIVSNIVENGLAIGGLGDGELVWHTDMSSKAFPPSATLLHAIEVPASGGRTAFLNMHGVYETLPENLKHRLAQLQLKHDAILDAAGYWRAGQGAPEDIRTAPGHIHPLVWTHPQTGRHALFLGRRPLAWIVGLELAESECLLDDLWSRAADSPEFMWWQTWRKGDVLIWDNRSVMHYREPFDPNGRRHLRRVVVRGTTAPAFEAEGPRAAECAVARPAQYATV